MTGRKRLWTLVFSAIAVAAMVFLSAGLSEFELLPGQPFSLGRMALSWLSGGGLSPGEAPVGILVRAIFILAGLLLPFAIIYFIISPEARKRVLRDLLFLLPILALYFLFLNGRYAIQGQEVELPAELPAEPLPVLSPADLVTPPPRWLAFVVSLGFILLVAAVLVGMGWFVWRRTRRPASSLEWLAREAQGALEALRSGADLKDTVIRCYYEMSRVLDEQQGIRRKRAMTPREFEQHLEQAGLPGQHVRRLTRLFEDVRYGAKSPGENEERLATTCLAAIVEACRSAS